MPVLKTLAHLPALPLRLGRRFCHSNLLLSGLLVLASGFTFSIFLGCSGSDSTDGSSEGSTEEIPDRSASTQTTDQASAERAPLVRGLEWILAQQAEDGGWHSDTYSLFEAGTGTTALVLYMAAHLPEETRIAHADRWQRAVDFLRPGIESEGCIASREGAKDYPIYATAMFLVAARQIPLEIPVAWEATLSEYLLRKQIADVRGIDPSSSDYGGWDLIREFDDPSVTAGSSISVSSYVLEALGPLTSSAAVTAREHATGWIARCAADADTGGFFFTTNPDSNKHKARELSEEGGSPLPYGSATADGLRCLAALQFSADDPLVTGSVTWLLANDRLDGVPGFDVGQVNLAWENGLVFYYYASLAQSLDFFSEESAAERAAAIQTAVSRRQREDGRWQNVTGSMREDDPLIATCLAMIALAETAD